MIQPVNALTPKVLFRGEPNSFEHPNKEHVQRNIAIINATGLSTATGAVMTAVARSYTNTWRHAGLIGLGCGAVTMMFIAPRFLYKSRINAQMKQQDMDKLVKDPSTKKKLLNEVSGTIEPSRLSKVEGFCKNLLRKSA